MAYFSRLVGSQIAIVILLVLSYPVRDARGADEISADVANSLNSGDAGAAPKPNHHQTRGFAYDLVKKRPLAASVSTYGESTYVGPDELGCPKYSKKLDSVVADEVTGFFSVEVGEGSLFTASFCKSGYASRTLLDQRVSSSQPWLVRRDVMLVDKQENVEAVSSAIEAEVDGFIADLLYLREAAPDALNKALARLSEVGSAEKRNIMAKLKSFLSGN